MALSKVRDYVNGTDIAFVTVVSAFENPSYRRVMIASDDGTCQGYERIADGTLFCGALVAPTPQKVTTDAAAQAQATDAAAALVKFMDRCGQLNAKAKAGTLTTAEINEAIAKLFKIVTALS